MYREVLWKEVSNEFTAVNPALAAAIEACNPSSALSFIQADYYYGDMIFNQKLQLRLNDNEIYPIDHNSIPSNIRHALSYQQCPVGILLSKSAEHFLETSSKTIVTKKCWTAGQLIGLKEQLINKQNTSANDKISAGARTTFLLPSISDTVLHSYLQNRLNILEPPPKNLYSQFNLFSEILRHKNSNDKWQCRILYFSDRWFKETDNPSILKLQSMLLRKSIKQFISQNELDDSQWEDFISLTSKKRVVIKPFFIHCIKFLLAISHGFLPGIKIVPPNDESLAPIKTISDAYIEDYGLKHYYPMIMAASHIKGDIHCHPIYYSLSQHLNRGTLFDLRRSPRIMEDFRSLKKVISLLQEYMGPQLKVEFKYFHPDEDNFNKILSSREIPNLDNNAKEYLKYYPDRDFPMNSPIFKGCIQITPKTSDN